MRLIVAYFAEWLRNGQTPRGAYCAMMSGRMITLDKQPGVRLVGVGETWQWLMEKCLLQVTWKEAKAACRTEQLAIGVEVGI